MRYKVKGLEIRTENAAKPIAQASRPLLNWLAQMKTVPAALDYGCGKLRYTGVVAKKCTRLTLVDSTIQLGRLQRIWGRETSVRSFAGSQWAHSRVLSVGEFAGDRERYDFVLCANVLSAIPVRVVRSKVLSQLSARLTPNGRCLLVTQYRNSYFAEAASRPNAVRHLDGWLLKTSRGGFYYGLVGTEKLAQLAQGHGFRVVQTWSAGQSAYVLGASANSI